MKSNCFINSISKLLIASIFMLSFSIAANINFGNASDNKIDVLYESDQPIGGFQFSLSGATVISASGGAAEEAGFDISIGSAAILGVSFTADSIPAGSGLLTTLTLDSTPLDICLNDLVVSNDTGSALSSDSGECYSIPESFYIGSVSESSLEVFYTSSNAIGGFQFSLTGGTATGASGGAAEEAGFDISIGSAAILGVSFSAGSIPAGSGLLTILTLDSYSSASDVCISNLVVSSSNGSSLSFDNGSCVALPCDDLDSDLVCDHADDCVGDYDCSGVCNGDSELDCAGDCDGDAVVDECDVCNGDGTSCLDEIISFGSLSPDSIEILYSSSEAIGGFQFSLTGATATGASGGAAEAAGFDVSIGSAAILGVSFTGESIPAGSGVLTNLSIEYNSESADACISNIVVSSPSGSGINFDAGNCAEVPLLPYSISIGSVSENHIDVVYSSSQPISGFQFSLTGATATGASGGAAEAAGFDVSIGSAAILGVSFSANTIPLGTGLLTTLSLAPYNEISDACITDIVVSDASGSSLPFEGGECVELPEPSCDDVDADGICDDIDDCVGDYDECGICNGDGIADGACDCDENVEDCTGECGGDAVLDECGVCNGDNTSCLDNVISLGAVSVSGVEVLYSSSVNISGFQFSITGATATGASGGAAEDAGFDVTIGQFAILGLSFTGASIPAGTGLLTNLDINYNQPGDLCLEGIVVSDPTGSTVDFDQSDCLSLPCADIDADEICDHADDCLDAVDECGVCGGDGSTCLDNVISFGAYDDSSIEVLYSTSSSIAAFQFSVTGVSLSDASGGAAEEAGLTVDSSEIGVVVGYSTSGAIISAGSGVLTNLTYTGTGTDICIEDLVVSDPDAQSLDFEIGSCLSNDCVDVDEDGICDDADDCVGEYDQCGECNGNGIDEGECDCAGNINDECGDCGGAFTDFDNFDYRTLKGTYNFYQDWQCDGNGGDGNGLLHLYQEGIAVLDIDGETFEGTWYMNEGCVTLADSGYCGFGGTYDIDFIVDFDFNETKIIEMNIDMNNI